MQIGKVIEDLLEIYIPVLMFLTLFVCFLLGIFFRYVLNNPQSWTFELSTICYLAVGVLSWGIAHRTDDLVVFDMLYNKLSPQIQCILRIVNNLIIAVVAAMLIVPSIRFLEGLSGLKAQTMDIPRFMIFVPFTISFCAATLRSAYRTVLDILSFKNKDYTQYYGKKEEIEV